MVHFKKPQPARKEAGNEKRNRSLLVTLIVLAIIVVLLFLAYFSITAVLRVRSFRRLEEGVNTVVEEITEKLSRDSLVLNATADVISQADSMDEETVFAALYTTAPLLPNIQLKVLLPDNRLLLSDGTVVSAAKQDGITFAQEAPLGEHIESYLSDDGEPSILRHYIPIVRDGNTVALLYGITRLADLRQSLNIDYIYNATANIYIIDTKSGNFLLDTLHSGLKNIADYSAGAVSWKTKGKLGWEDYIEDLVSLGTGYVIFRAPNTGGWEYMHYAPAGINRWAIAVSVPEKEAFSSVFAVRRISIGLGVLILLVIFLYYLWVSRTARKFTEQAVERAVLTEKLQKAEAADKAKSVFLSNMSHDIRTPMNAIIGFTTLAQANLGNRERTEEYLNKILSSSNHLLSLINDILDMSRIESGKLNIEENPCSLSKIFKDMRNIIQTQMQSKQLNFFMDTVDVVNENIYCDKLHVNQVLLNLLSNAIKFTPSGGTVSLTIRQKPNAPEGYGSYEIIVKDTGMGMSQEFTQHIFEPFERERNTTASGIQGTGLGMAITKNIVDAMGGTIELHSEQGKGTEFIICLDFRLQSDAQPIEIVPELQGLRVLVADDSFSSCDSIVKMLLQIGMRPEWVLHGKEAVLHVRQAHELGDEYHAYVIDWFLPDLSGLEVIRQIRAAVGKQAPIIVITAYDPSAFEEDARAAGATAFCNKPVFLSELRNMLVSAISGQPSASPESTVLSEDQARFRGMRLLLAEDNELNREIASELLTEKGFLIETAEDGNIAVDKVKNSKPGYYALVLMDIQMPHLNGYEATKAIRALSEPALARIPIVAMTANAFEEDRKLALENGMDAHIAKPINVEQLLKVIADILQQGA